MLSPGSSFLAGLACGALIFGGYSAAAATPGFTIAATDVTMQTNGNPTSSKFTLTSVDGYAGPVRVDCAYSGGMMGAKVPSCGIYVSPQHNLGANQTVTGTLTLFPYGKVVPYASTRLLGGQRSTAPVWAVLVLGLIVVRRRLGNAVRHWLWLLLVAGAGLMGMTSCATGLSGTFPYTVTATDVNTHNVVSAPFSVIVP